MAIKLNYPTNYRKISAGYPNYSNGKYHGGVDWPCSKGTLIHAAADGVVTVAKNLNYSYGHYLIINHGNGLSTLYAHNTTLLVSVGDKVKRGQVIAKSGSTGNSTGPHCHFEVRLNGKRVNPLNYLKDTGKYTDTNDIFNSSNSIVIEYIEWTGKGTIKKDETNLLWYIDSEKPVKNWGFNNGEFFGMKGEVFKFLGRTIDKKYYYGRCVGLCNSTILCVVPCDKVNKGTGKSTGKKKSFTTGISYSSDNS